MCSVHPLIVPDEGCGLVQLMCLCENMLGRVHKTLYIVALGGVNLEVHNTLYIVALEGEGEGELHYCFSRLGLHNGEKLEQLSNRLRLPPIFLKHLKNMGGRPSFFFYCLRNMGGIFFQVFEEHGGSLSATTG